MDAKDIEHLESLLRDLKKIDMDIAQITKVAEALAIDDGDNRIEICVNVQARDEEIIEGKTTVCQPFFEYTLDSNYNLISKKVEEPKTLNLKVKGDIYSSLEVCGTLLRIKKEQRNKIVAQLEKEWKLK